MHELKKVLDATDQKAQYDASAKRLLSEKHILSHILVRTVDEFKGMDPNDVIDKIEGEPYISSVPVEPGLTNKAEGDRVVGSYEWRGKIDIFNIVMIGLTNELPDRSEKYELHRLLAALLSNGLPRQVKQKIVDEEYGMHMEADVRGGLDIMCNLGQGIEDRALEKGRAEGLEIGRIEGEKLREREIAKNLKSASLPLNLIAQSTGLTIAEVESI